MKYAFVVAVFTTCIGTSLAFPVPARDGTPLTLGLGLSDPHSIPAPSLDTSSSPPAKLNSADFPQRGRSSSPRRQESPRVPSHSQEFPVHIDHPKVGSPVDMDHLTPGEKGDDIPQRRERRHIDASQKSLDLTTESATSPPSGRMTTGKVKIDPWVRRDLDRFFDSRNHPKLNDKYAAARAVNDYLKRYRMFPMSEEVAASIYEGVVDDNVDNMGEGSLLVAAKHTAERIEQGAKALQLQWESVTLDDVDRFFVREKLLHEQPDPSTVRHIYVRQSLDLVDRYFTEHRVPRVSSVYVSEIYNKANVRTRIEQSSPGYAERVIRYLEEYLETSKSPSPNSIRGDLADM